LGSPGYFIGRINLFTLNLSAEDTWDFRPDGFWEPVDGATLASGSKQREHSPSQTTQTKLFPTVLETMRQCLAVLKQLR